MTSLTRATFTPPIPASRRWIQGVDFPPERALINLSQAAPVDPPHPDLRAAMSAALEDPTSHLYGPVLGNDALRTALAQNWSAHYGAPVRAAEIAITAGCNQAFAAATAATCGTGDAVILPTPWYFNHKMWLDMVGIDTIPLATDDALLPDPRDAERLITPRTRAIVLVTPNNPGGVEYPAELMNAFFDLAQRHGLRLIVDETYRDFDQREGAPHDLLSRPDWQDTLIQLYSFSKAYRLTGHRVGAMIAGEHLMPEVEKFLDTVTICPPQMGQIAATWGLGNLGDWLAGERQEILRRRAAIVDTMPMLEARGWRLKGAGAYFAYLEHPFAEDAETLAQALVHDAGVLLLPGTMFMPEEDPAGARHLRMAFANADADGLRAAMTRLASVDRPLAAAKA